jgi:uncharacterized phiE125 gp8 family phage protein
VTTAIRLVSGPAVSPVSLSEAKAHLRVDSNDEDAFISALIEAAVSHVDGQGQLGRAMITQDWAQYENQSPGWVRLTMGPFQSLVSVEYYDADGVLQSATLSDFETRLDRDFVICKPKENKTWPNADTRQDAIKITYRAGFGSSASDVPAGIKHALLLLIGHWYENRMAVSDLKYQEVPVAVESLINNQRVGWYG